MKKIMLNIHNSLMAASITRSLHQSFIVSTVGTVRGIAQKCAQNLTDALIVEVAYGTDTSIDDCLQEAGLLRNLYPQCRVILLCDDNSAPEIARQVAQAKKNGQIDDFVYSSVSESYLTALLSAI